MIFFLKLLPLIWIYFLTFFPFALLLSLFFFKLHPLSILSLDYFTYYICIASIIYLTYFTISWLFTFILRKKSHPYYWALNTLHKLSENITSSSYSNKFLQFFIPYKVFLVLGNKQSGKSFFLAGSELKTCSNMFEFSDHGSLFQQWWYKHSCFFLETSYLSSQSFNQDSSLYKYWQHLKYMLSWKYNIRGFSGIILTISAQSLLYNDRSHLSQRLSILHNQLEILNKVSPSTPVFFVITAIDTLPHFYDFFDGLSLEDLDKNLGVCMSLSQARNTNLTNIINQLSESLEQQLIKKIAGNTKKYDHVKNLHEFSQSFQNLQTELLNCISKSIVNIDNPICGLFYTGAHNEKKSIPIINDSKIKTSTPSFPFIMQKHYFTKHVISQICSKTLWLSSKYLQFFLTLCVLVLSLYQSNTIMDSVLEKALLLVHTNVEEKSTPINNFLTIDPYLLLDNINKDNAIDINNSSISKSLSIYTNTSKTYPTYLKNVFWPKLIAELEKNNTYNDNIRPYRDIQNTLMILMLSGHIEINQELIDQWFSEQRDEISILSEQYHVLQDLINSNEKFDISPFLSFISPRIKSISNYGQIETLFEIFYKVNKVKKVDDSSLIQIASSKACSIKNELLSILGPWNEIKDIEECRIFLLNKNAENIIVKQQQILDKLLVEPYADTDLNRIRKKLIYLRANSESIISTLKNSAQNSLKIVNSLGVNTKSSNQIHEKIYTIDTIDKDNFKKITDDAIVLLQKIIANKDPDSEAANIIMDMAINNTPIEETIFNTKDPILKPYIKNIENIISSLAKNSINKKWNEQIMDFLERNNNNQNEYFPLKKQGSGDLINIDIFNELFSPKGKIELFIDKYLLAILDQNANGELVWKKTPGVHNLVNSSLPQLIMGHKIIQSMYFPDNSSEAHFDASLTLRNASKDIKKIIINFSDQRKLTLDIDSRQPLFVQWPEQGTKSILQAELSNGDIITMAIEQGPWALLNLIKNNNSRKLAPNSFLLLFQNQGQKVELELNTHQKMHPLSGDISNYFFLPVEIFPSKSIVEE